MKASIVRNTEYISCTSHSTSRGYTSTNYKIQSKNKRNTNTACRGFHVEGSVVCGAVTDFPNFRSSFLSLNAISLSFRAISLSFSFISDSVFACSQSSSPSPTPVPLRLRCFHFFAFSTGEWRSPTSSDMQQEESPDMSVPASLLE